MKIILNKKIYLVLAFSVMLLPQCVFSSNVYIDSNRQNFFVGDTVIFSVRVDSQNMNINTVEGSVMIEYQMNSVSLTDINTSGSKFSLWPNKPLPSADNKSISFAGGSTVGINSKDATVFNVVLRLQKTGQIVLTPNNIGVYLHDGKGTQDTVSIKNLVINVLPEKSDSQSVDDWSNLISNDKTPPKPFEIYLGQEGSVFDGKKFISFSTTDDESGINYYIVSEGNLPPVRSGSTYVLQNQEILELITVSAFDKAGNLTISKFDPTARNNLMKTLGILAVVLLLILVIWFLIKRKIKYAT